MSAMLRRSALATLPRPSSSQVAAFVEYVFRAHSWYKHLPRFLPGKTFSFYLDPAVGHAVVSRPDGSLSLVERLEGEAFFHYNEMPTCEYHARFGARLPRRRWDARRAGRATGSRDGAAPSLW